MIWLFYLLPQGTYAFSYMTMMIGIFQLATYCLLGTIIENAVSFCLVYIWSRWIYYGLILAYWVDLLLLSANFMPNQLKVLRTVFIDESGDANPWFESLLVGWRILSSQGAQVMTVQLCNWVSVRGIYNELSCSCVFCSTEFGILRGSILIGLASVVRTTSTDIPFFAATC